MKVLCYFAETIKISGKARFLQSKIMPTSESSLLASALKVMTVSDW